MCSRAPQNQKVPPKQMYQKQQQEAKKAPLGDSAQPRDRERRLVQIQRQGTHNGLEHGNFLLFTAGLHC